MPIRFGIRTLTGGRGATTVGDVTLVPVPPLVWSALGVALRRVPAYGLFTCRGGASVKNNGFVFSTLSRGSRKKRDEKSLERCWKN